jgi:hypothetical protein
MPSNAQSSSNTPQVLEVRPFKPDELQQRADAEDWLWCHYPWVFQDPNSGAQRLFVMGGDYIVGYAARRLMPDARKGFRLLFSDQPFEGSECARLTELQFGGASYLVDTPDALALYNEPIEGWFCEPILAWFNHFPEKLHFQALPLEGTMAPD